ncbi:hypothetical protein C8F01DRAFT_1329504 [Mycena amicta]|nr:hypothetical protein C8F01DRAFT_1329504 [Mycena amicta]
MSNGRATFVSSGVESAQTMCQLHRNPFANNAALLREQKAQLDERILQAEMHLESLKAQRILVEEELSKIVYPVLSLPSELTTRIFALAVATGVADHDPVLLQLAAVCPQWRAVALDNSGLWQCIAFTSDVSDPEQLFLCFAQRSGTLPLDISILIRGEETWEIPLGILRSSARWKTAHFLSLISDLNTAPSVCVPRQFSGSLALSLLDELTMNLTTRSSEDCAMLLRDAHCLHNLCFGHPALVPHVGLPTEQLQTLQFIVKCPHVELLEVLRHARNLETLILPRQQWAVDTYTGPPLPIYHNLHTLSLVSGLVPVVIDQLTAPALHTLHLPRMATGRLSESVLAFLTRSGCTIRTLSFRRGMEYQRVSTLLRSPTLASVSHVTLPAQYMPQPEEASNFASLLGDGTFLPGLKSLTVIVPPSSAPVIAPYLLGVIKRAERVGKLESTSAEGTPAISRIDELTLKFDFEALHDEDIQNLKYLGEELGVRVIFPNGLPSRVRKSSTATL